MLDNRFHSNTPENGGKSLMKYGIARLALIVVCLALLAGCGGQGQNDTGSGASPTQALSPTAISAEVEQPTATTAAPTLETLPTATTEVAEAIPTPTLPAVVAEEPTATAMPSGDTAGGAQPSLIFFTAPG
jgi:hypothetical protein